MGLLEAILVFAVGYVCGAATLVVARVAAIFALGPSVLDIALSSSIVAIVVALPTSVAGIAVAYRPCDREAVGELYDRAVSYRLRVVTSHPSSVTITVCSFWLTRKPSSSFRTG